MQKLFFDTLIVWLFCCEYMLLYFESCRGFFHSLFLFSVVMVKILRIFVCICLVLSLNFTQLAQILLNGLIDDDTWSLKCLFHNCTAYIFWHTNYAFLGTSPLSSLIWCAWNWRDLMVISYRVLCSYYRLTYSLHCTLL